jgi:dihydrolipoamide dehydrogenase
MTAVLKTDIAVIGAGTAGSLAFHEITRAGRQALLIDRGPLGTTCARVGCMPSKAALHAGRQWADFRQLLAGNAPPAGCSAEALWQQARATRDALATAAAQRTRTAAGERLLMGAARFVAPDTLDVDGQLVQARAFVIATGSRPVVPAALNAAGNRLLTTDSLFELDRLPHSIGIAGLGAIGLEMGLALSRLGVHVIAADLKSMPAGISDPAIADRALQRFGRELTLWLGRPVQAQATAAGVRFWNGESEATVDVVLAALGRRPNVEALELGAAGVALDDHGQPVIDPVSLRAGAAPLFLAGDVQPDRPLMHEAADEGVIAARGALAVLDGAVAQLPARRTPITIVFSDPDICAVGTGWDQLDRQRTVVGSAEGSGNGRSKILGAQDNLVRIYADRASGRLLGASLISTHGEHLAHLLAWAVQRAESVTTLLAMPYYHPSVEEMVQSALKDAAQQLATAQT